MKFSFIQKPLTRALLAVSICSSATAYADIASPGVGSASITTQLAQQNQIKGTPWVIYTNTVDFQRAIQRPQVNTNDFQYFSLTLDPTKGFGLSDVLPIIAQAKTPFLLRISAAQPTTFKAADFEALGQSHSIRRLEVAGNVDLDRQANISSAIMPIYVNAAADSKLRQNLAAAGSHRIAFELNDTNAANDFLTGSRLAAKSYQTSTLDLFGTQVGFALDAMAKNNFTVNKLSVGLLGKTDATGYQAAGRMVGNVKDSYRVFLGGAGQEGVDQFAQGLKTGTSARPASFYILSRNRDLTVDNALTAYSSGASRHGDSAFRTNMQVTHLIGAAWLEVGLLNPSANNSQSALNLINSGGLAGYQAIYTGAGLQSASDLLASASGVASKAFVGKNFTAITLAATPEKLKQLPSSATTLAWETGRFKMRTASAPVQVNELLKQQPNTLVSLAATPTQTDWTVLRSQLPEGAVVRFESAGDGAVGKAGWNTMGSSSLQAHE